MIDIKIEYKSAKKTVKSTDVFIGSDRIVILLAELTTTVEHVCDLLNDMQLDVVGFSASSSVHSPRELEENGAHGEFPCIDRMYDIPNRAQDYEGR